MAIKFTDILEPNNPKTFAIAKAGQLSGHRTVINVEDLYSIIPQVLSPSYNPATKIGNVDNDAIGQVWYVSSQDKYYRLIDWENRSSADGWEDYKGFMTDDIDLSDYATKAQLKLYAKKSDIESGINTQSILGVDATVEPDPYTGLSPQTGNRIYLDDPSGISIISGKNQMAYLFPNALPPPGIDTYKVLATTSDVAANNFEPLNQKIDNGLAAIREYVDDNAAFIVYDIPNSFDLKTSDIGLSLTADPMPITLGSIKFSSFSNITDITDKNTRFKSVKFIADKTESSTSTGFNYPTDDGPDADTSINFGTANSDIISLNGSNSSAKWVCGSQHSSPVSPYYAIEQDVGVKNNQNWNKNYIEQELPQSDRLSLSEDFTVSYSVKNQTAKPQTMFYLTSNSYSIAFGNSYDDNMYIAPGYADEQIGSTKFASFQKGATVNNIKTTGVVLNKFNGLQTPSEFTIVGVLVGVISWQASKNLLTFTIKNTTDISANGEQDGRNSYTFNITIDNKSDVIFDRVGFFNDSLAGQSINIDYAQYKDAWTYEQIRKPEEFGKLNLYLFENTEGKYKLIARSQNQIDYNSSYTDGEVFEFNIVSTEGEGSLLIDTSKTYYYALSKRTLSVGDYTPVGDYINNPFENYDKTAKNFRFKAYETSTDSGWVTKPNAAPAFLNVIPDLILNINVGDYVKKLSQKNDITDKSINDIFGDTPKDIFFIEKNGSIRVDKPILYSDTAEKDDELVNLQTVKTLFNNKVTSVKGFVSNTSEISEIDETTGYYKWTFDVYMSEAFDTLNNTSTIRPIIPIVSLWNNENELVNADIKYTCTSGSRLEAKVEFTILIDSDRPVPANSYTLAYDIQYIIV